MTKLPFISIIIPCRNEEKFIGKCLDSIIGQDFSNENMEILVVDGMSDDRTRDIIANYAKQFSFIKQLENPNKIVPTAMNIGILKSKGKIIIRMDAHNTYEKDYISKCIKYMKEYDADNVGGIWITLPSNKSLLAKSIALALSNPFGVGNAHFRIGSKEPRYVDTVPFGCYRKEVFEENGLFDEDLIRNQDDEFNLRLIRNGGKILLVPDIVSYYYARDSLSKLWQMYYQYGYFKPLVTHKIGAILTWRQLIPSLFLCSLMFTFVLSFFSYYFMRIFLLIIASYIATNLIFSFAIAIEKSLKLLAFLPITFATLHFSYALGYLKGIWDFVVFKKHKNKKIADMALTR